MDNDEQKIVSQKIISKYPVVYRLTEKAVMFGNKTIVLQGLYPWVCGEMSGEEWRDMPSHFELIR